jgi:hypothetical protein
VRSRWIKCRKFNFDEEGAVIKVLALEKRRGALASGVTTESRPGEPFGLKR